MTRINRRTLLALAAAPVLGLAQIGAFAQATDFPTRAVRIVLPFAPGAANDLVLRVLADKLSQKWGQPVLVDNKPGGGTIIGSDAVAKAAPDGHTLLANVSAIVQNPALRKKMPYDTARDLAPVAQINRQHLVLVARSDLPIRNVAELVAYSKSHADKVNFATWGIASTAHMIFEKVKIDTGAPMVHVPYKGSQEINKALLTGEADVAVMDIVTPLPHIRSGKLRAIAVNGPIRAPLFPEVQTLSEGGISGFEPYGWLGLFAPAGTPPAIIAKIAEDLNSVQADPALAKRWEDLQVYPSQTTPAQFRAIFEKDLATWTAVIRRTGLTVD
jgi:tripartite-type tricarboxylate transporter receptor subunit TctC